MEKMQQRRILERDAAVIDTELYRARDGCRCEVVIGRRFAQTEPARRLRTAGTRGKRRDAGRDDIGERDCDRLCAGGRIDRLDGPGAELMRTDVT